MTLQLDEGATLLGSPNRFDYRKLDFHALILANKQQNIGIRGKGVIDGQGKLLAEQTMRLLAEGKLRDSEPGNRPYASVGERPVIINFNKCTQRHRARHHPQGKRLLGPGIPGMHKGPD